MLYNSTSSGPRSVIANTVLKLAAEQNLDRQAMQMAFQLKTRTYKESFKLLLKHITPASHDFESFKHDELQGSIVPCVSTLKMKFLSTIALAAAGFATAVRGDCTCFSNSC